MVPFGQVVERLQRLMEDDSTETEADIKSFMNESYRQIASDHVWNSLRASITQPTTVLPADMERPVIYVQDDTNYTYFRIDLSDRYMTARLYNFFMDGVVETPLSTGSDMVVTANSTTVTSASPSLDFDDSTLDLAEKEYIQIGENEGMYRIEEVTDANTLVLSRAYRGDSDTAQYYEVRPRGTSKIQYNDYDGEALTPSSTSKLWYQKRPLPLYNDYDQIELPGTCRAVRIMAFQMLKMRDQYDNDALKQQSDYQAAIDVMQPLDKQFGKRQVPRDRMGTQISYGRNRHRFRTDSSGRAIL